MDCEAVQYVPLAVAGAIAVISEILPFIPKQYVQANSILELIVNVLKAIPLPKKAQPVNLTPPKPQV